MSNAIILSISFLFLHGFRDSYSSDTWTPVAPEQNSPWLTIPVCVAGDQPLERSEAKGVTVKVSGLGPHSCLVGHTGRGAGLR